ncbi:GNAT family N-acetyltransferase [Oceanomicrobium pacificus]|uniref:GNAT family N-acetyltransferase n=1 Tax=Oceanomicrobium pacificus TaxID=2692916 RepID=A0A6B0TW58_9RHOB|nr:GNAT family N-acetyltransferase [Oceanomicrobium pacificus]MXU65482.1 GNAT family N-acetyltransferase [Oceanomicrobium pacificus]
MTLAIRPLTPADEADWRRLWTAYLDFYEATVPEPVYATTFRRLCSDDPQEFHGRLAVRDGVPVGLVHYLFHRHCWRVENTVYLQDLYVAPEARGTGAGRALIEHVYAAADEAGCPSIYWLTQEGNATARQLYDRIGKKSDFIVYRRPA